jgi:hypothetical protein
VKPTIKPAADGAPVVTCDPSARDLLTYKDQKLLTGPYLTRMLHAAGRTLVNTPHGTHVADLACPHCKEPFNVAEQRPALKVIGGTYHGDGTTNDPCRLACNLCGHRIQADTLGAVLWPNGRSKVYDAHFHVTRLAYQRFPAVRYGDKQKLGTDFTEVALSMVGKVFDPLADFEAILLLAQHRDVALAALQQSDALPWVVVACTPQLEPRSNWHGLKMSVSEEAQLDRVRDRAQRERQSVINQRLRAAREQLEAEIPQP